MDSELEPLPYPTKASVYQHRSPRSHKRVLEDANITLEVETTKIMILENEPSAEKFRLGEAREQSGPEPMKCTTSENYVSNTLLLTTLGVLQVISILALITQRFYYKKSIDNLIYADDRPGSRKF
ncbi:ZP domain-containing protein [Caenorhabditis elegans]|nr:ZP domain-containing protein [Caenorhabditis elegans]CZR14496.1 ZP domain-containing protein [Caenorhabditis elegans]|eukprot:NP_001309580.1 CUTiclin-Like [Caenorhabditis elegans]